ncbi:hypothetical protein [Brevundimonas sp. GN22]
MRDWPTKQFKVEVVIDGKSTTYEKHLKGADTHAWTAWLLNRDRSAPTPFGEVQISP